MLLVPLLTGIGPLLVEGIDFLLSGSMLAMWIVSQRSPIPPRERVLGVTQWAFVLASFVTACRAHGALVGLLPACLHGVIYYLFSQVSHTNDDSSVEATPWHSTDAAVAEGANFSSGAGGPLVEPTRRPRARRIVGVPGHEP